MSYIVTENRLLDESPELQRVVRELAAVVNLLAGRVFVGTGTPEAVIVADKGALYLRTDGTASTVLYVKEADAGLATGWAGK